MLEQFTECCGRAGLVGAGVLLSNTSRRGHKSAKFDVVRKPLQGCRGFCLLSLLMLLATGCGTVPDLETSRRFQGAEETFATAKSADDFVQAAAQFQEVLDGGFQSGSVYYNQGNAWMQAGQTGRAIAAYRLAQRSLPRDPYLAANLRQALVKSGNAEANGKSILDYVFFWQNSLSYSEKAWLVTLLLICVLLLALAGQLVSFQTELKRINACVAVVLVLAAVSVARDWSQIELTKHGAIVASTVARKGGADSYEPAFNQSLVDGTEFVVMSEQSDWLQIQVVGIGAGWVPVRNCVTY
jgi:hypothetical protein